MIPKSGDRFFGQDHAPAKETELGSDSIRPDGVLSDSP
jgi:hypothetical protein